MPDLFLELRDDSGGGEQTPAPLAEDEALDLLRNAEFSASRLIPWGSNYSFAVALEEAYGLVSSRSTSLGPERRRSTTFPRARSIYAS